MPAAPHINLAEWQEHLDFLLPRRELLRADQIAGAIGVDEKTIHRLFDSATLHGHEVNAAKGERQHRRYRRDSVILFLADRANYAPADLRLKLLGILIKQPLSELVLFHQALGEQIRRKQA
ncbi:MAG TPA: hypothetical protein VK961_00040 [Chthoniobacter sp.]|nr:hypothetical protein [Chthoniobacter sp.]